MSETGTAQLRVLLVEDNHVDAAVLGALLAEHAREEYQLSTVGDLTDALTRLSSDEPDCVLLDLSLPDSCGLDTVQSVVGVAPDVPIVIYSGLQDEQIAKAALNLGAQDYLIKGREGEEQLWRTIRFAVERAKSQSERRHADMDSAREVFEKSEQRFRLAFENNAASTVFLDLEGNILEANDAYCEMLGRRKEEIVGKDLSLFTHPGDERVTVEARERLTSEESDHVTYLKRYLKRGGRVLDAEVSLSPARDETGSIIYSVASVRNVSAERALIAQLSHQALHDHLTGLANRVLFEDRLLQAHSRVVRQGGWSAVAMLDLDDFKDVNDTLGHHVDDGLLVAAARRLEGVTRSSDTLCRLGGDEFLYLAEDLASRAQAEEMAQRLLEVFSEPFLLEGSYREQRASIGVAVFDRTSQNAAALIQDADVAMYEVKRQGKGRHVLFAPEMYELAGGRFELVQELKLALKTGALAMHYQPILDLSTNDVVGFEALMRWQNTTRGPIPPDVFIPIAEQGELIFGLGAFALREAVDEAASWRGTGGHDSLPFVSVNLSARQFHDPDLISMIERTLSSSELASERLLLEITESAALFDVVETRRIMDHLYRLGIEVALDDFGTGYSSLAYLTMLRPSTIKIDRSFISPAQESVYNDTLVEAIVSLGHRLNMTVLAEGIETQAQLEHLRHLRCERGQGYLFSPAVPPDEVEALLVRNPA
jgi:diguanylate cyclase (GGDEF)-like protein/PAS domain S-box-containing protein